MFGLVPFRRDNNSLSRRGDSFNQLVDSFFNDSLFKDDFLIPTTMEYGNFTVDLKENKNEYVLEADLPGVNKEAIDLEFSNNYLTISAKRENIVEDKKDNYVRRERSYGEFKRRFYIDNVDSSKIKAEFRDGVLSVTLPKADPDKENKGKIEIR